MHPMAFDFPTRFTDRLFFPTFHVHHGKFEEKARYDHTLYCQGISERTALLGGDVDAWSPSLSVLGEVVYRGIENLQADVAKLVDLDAHGWQAMFNGPAKNRDIWWLLDDNEWRFQVGAA